VRREHDASSRLARQPLSRAQRRRRKAYA